MLPTPSSILRRPFLSRLRAVLLSRAGLLAFAGLGGGLGLGACSAVLDFTECTEDIDCADFFTAEMKPMQCSDQKCVARTGCTSNSQCAGLGEGHICNLSGSCAATTSDQCGKPIYPDDTPSDEVIFIGSIVARSGDDAALGALAEKAFKRALDEFHAGGGTVKVGDAAQMVALVPCDSANSTVSATAAAKHLGTGLTVPAILGPLDDDELVKIAKDVSVANGVLAYTHSPTATADISFDDKSLVWLSNPKAAYQGRAFGSHIKQEIDGNVFETTDPAATLLFASDAYGYSMYYALAIQEQDGQPNRIPEINSQVVSSYNNLDTGKLRVDSFGDTDILIILGGAEVAELLRHLKTTNKGVWPRRVYVTQRSFAAVKALGDATLVPSLRVIAPDLETANLAALRKRIGDAAAPAEYGLAYDAAMVTLLAMSSHTGAEPITGVSIRAAMGRMSDPAGTPVSFGDPPATFVKAAVAALQAGKTVNLTGASGALDYGKDGSICGDMVAFGLDPTGKNLVPVDHFDADCSTSPLTGTWAPAN